MIKKENIYKDCSANKTKGVHGGGEYHQLRKQPKQRCSLLSNNAKTNTASKGGISNIT
ncbi:hypothetical protein [Psychromonas aquimarina]|uniref:hypothetical protein n=1 Tax=Psychromonas aquimarina TaxID=444919 RepID=UPI000410FDC1|nr:hypothetical protein [Psychromonas aquimarina]